jgi:hypothetical protein
MKMNKKQLNGMDLMLISATEIAAKYVTTKQGTDRMSALETKIKILKDHYNDSNLLALAKWTNMMKAELGELISYLGKIESVALKEISDR